MRRIAKQQEGDGAEIDLTPMLDVVFIMLIFFIVVASFIKEAGVEVNRPDDNQQTDPEDSISIVVEVAADNQIWMENRRVDVRAVRANIQRLLAEDPEAPVTVKERRFSRVFGRRNLRRQTSIGCGRSSSESELDVRSRRWSSSQVFRLSKRLSRSLLFWRRRTTPTLSSTNPSP